MEEIMKCNETFDGKLSFVPNGEDIKNLCNKATEAHVDIMNKKRTPLLSKSFDLSANCGLCPESLNPDDTVLSQLGRKSEVKNQTYAIIDNRTITLAGGKGNSSFGPNCVMYNCNGVINLFDCEPQNLQQGVREFLGFRNENSLNILKAYTAKLTKHREIGYKVALGKDDAIVGDVRHHYDVLVEMYSILAQLCKDNNIHEYGLGIQSYCQTWMRNGNKASHAQFSVMSPHYQTRVIIKDPHLLKFMLGRYMESKNVQCDIEHFFTAYVFLHNYCMDSMPEYGTDSGGQAFVNIDELCEKINVLYIGGGGGGDTAMAATYALTHSAGETPYVMGAGNSRQHTLKYISAQDIRTDDNIRCSVNNTRRNTSRVGFSQCDAHAYMNAKIDESCSTEMIMKLRTKCTGEKIDFSLLGNTQYGSLEEESAISAYFGSVYMISVVGGDSAKYFDSDGLPMNKSKMSTEIEKTTQALQDFVKSHKIQKIVYIDVGLDVTQDHTMYETFKRDDIVLYACRKTNLPLEVIGLGPGADGHANPAVVAERAKKIGFREFTNPHFLNILNSRYDQLSSISSTMLKPGRANRIFHDASNAVSCHMTHQHTDQMEVVHYFRNQLSKRVENTNGGEVTFADVVLMGSLFKLEV
tara:strand:+ start:4515 stop:6428 length:1914 start_codon:yes stop_codon:yes gene_type:complete